jgi:hypothetical protein
MPSLHRYGNHDLSGTVVFLGRVRRLLVTADADLSTPILVTLMREALRHSS